MNVYHILYEQTFLNRFAKCCQCKNIQFRRQKKKTWWETKREGKLNFPINTNISLTETGIAANIARDTLWTFIAAVTDFGRYFNIITLSSALIWNDPEKPLQMMSTLPQLPAKRR